MKKDYSSLFNHYDGLLYDGSNYAEMYQVHQLMEDAGIVEEGLTRAKFDMYSDKRPFKVHFFISKQGKKIKWCPTASEEKKSKMNLKPASWWITQLGDSVKVVSEISVPKNWLEQQAEAVRKMVFSKIVSKSPVITDDLTETTQDEEYFEQDEVVVVASEDEELPF